MVVTSLRRETDSPVSSMRIWGVSTPDPPVYRRRDAYLTVSLVSPVHPRRGRLAAEVIRCSTTRSGSLPGFCCALCVCDAWCGTAWTARAGPAVSPVNCLVSSQKVGRPHAAYRGDDHDTRDQAGVDRLLQAAADVSWSGNPGRLAGHAIPGAGRRHPGPFRRIGSFCRPGRRSGAGRTADRGRPASALLPANGSGEACQGGCRGACQGRREYRRRHPLPGRPCLYYRRRLCRLAWGSAGGGKGGVVSGIALLVAAVARLVLPARLVGLLGTRNRVIDVLTLAIFGSGLLIAGFVLPR